MNENSSIQDSPPGFLQSLPADLEKINHLSQENNLLKTEVSDLKLALEKTEAKMRWLEEQCQLSRQRQFGKSSEVSPQQLPLNIFNAEETPTAIEATLPATEKETVTYTRQKPAKKGRLIDTRHLPRQTIVHDLKEEEKNCGDCQHALQKIGEDKKEQLEVIPQQLYVVEHVHPKYTCRHCDTIKMAPKKLSPIPKSMAGASLLATVIVNKYENHLPLYRQAQMLKSRGTNIPNVTLGNWMMQCGEALLPLADAHFADITQTDYLQVDETPVQVLKPHKKGYLWGYLTPQLNAVMFEFSLSRSSAVVEKRLQHSSGKLQTDGYSGYQGLRQQSRIIALACFAHVRRKFMDIIKLAPNKPGKAQEAVIMINQLYHLETQAKEHQLNGLQRQRWRQQHAKPLLNTLHQWLIDTIPGTPQQSTLYQAIRYCLNQWSCLIRYVDYGDVEPDTNWIENQIRPFAIGRKNWLFVGHEQSAQIGALFYSLIQTCRLQHLNPYLYLHYALTQVHELRKGTIEPRQLLPQQVSKEILDLCWQNHQQSFQPA